MNKYPIPESVQAVNGRLWVSRSYRTSVRPDKSRASPQPSTPAERWYDLVLLDGAKGLYNDILDRLESRLRPGTLLLGDNADMCPAYLERVRVAGGGYLSIPFGDDVELSMKIG